MTALRADDIRFIGEIVLKGGPSPEDYPVLDNWFDRMGSIIAARELSLSDVAGLRAGFGEILSSTSLMGFVYTRPHGYAGDFEIIDRIYTEHISPDPRFARWDFYFQSRPATKAVRNRKTYFHDILSRHISTQGHLKVLKLASGPGRSMFEWLSLHPAAKTTFHCVELDPKAIAYAQLLNEPFLDHITFEQGNVIQFRPTEQYDLIWAAGLFDYFSDRAFQSIIRRLVPAIAIGGELVIGNFCSTNPTRACMEFCNWQLHHRTTDDLISLATGSGARREAIWVGAEPQGVNLFLHVRA